MISELPKAAEYFELPVHGVGGAVAAHALVDEADRALVEGHYWRLAERGYVRASGPKRRKISLHRLIMGAGYKDGRFVDHINRCPLDNRRSNLRLVTPAESAQNVPARKTSTSRFRGVSYHEKGQSPWIAQGAYQGKRYIRRFKSEVEAALAIQAWRDEHMPLSLPDEALVELGLA